MNLSGRAAIVTGGAVRIGRALALALGRAGADVCVHYGRSADDAERTRAEIAACGVRAVTVSADLADPATAATTIVAAAHAAFGKIDVLVNSAAIFEADSLATLDLDAWRRTQAINLEAPAYLCREFVARLVPGQPAHVVNVVDWRAERPGSGHLAYTASKAGLVALTKSLALALAPQVQVNAIALGAILAPPGADADHRRRAAERIPLRRTGAPDDVARALLHLVASDFVTGEILHVTGGEEL